MNLVKTDKPIKLGRQLGVEDRDLALVKKDHPTDHGQQLEDVLSLYMRQSVKPSWEEVATALWDIGEKRTAQQIADEYGMAFSMCSSIHQISYMNMISACHLATVGVCVVINYILHVAIQTSTLSPTSTPGFPLPVQPTVPTPGPSSSLHAPTSGKLHSHSYMLVGKCNLPCLCFNCGLLHCPPQVYTCYVSIVKIIANVSRPILSYNGDIEVHDAF